MYTTGNKGCRSGLGAGSIKIHRDVLVTHCRSAVCCDAAGDCTSVCGDAFYCPEVEVSQQFWGKMGRFIVLQKKRCCWTFLTRWEVFRLRLRSSDKWSHMNLKQETRSTYSTLLILSVELFGVWGFEGRPFYSPRQSPSFTLEGMQQWLEGLLPVELFSMTLGHKTTAAVQTWESNKPSGATLLKTAG